MKIYIGAKAVKARECGYKEFAVITGKPYIPNLDEDGYLIIYPDGHTSWSPKKIFETAYREIGPELKNLEDSNEY